MAASKTSSHASEIGSVFDRSFSVAQRQALMKEDREAQMGISAILSCLIATGMVLGIISVIIISTYGF